MPSVLIVEDEAPLRRIVTLNLVAHGYSVAEAECVESAEQLLHAATVPFDVMLLDVNLPDASGWDLLRREEWHDAAAHPDALSGAAHAPPCVIVMTAVRPIQRRLDEFHPAGLILKPFPMPALLRLLDRVLDGRVRSHRAG